MTLPARRKEGPRAPLFIAAALLVPAANAQPVDRADLEHCAAEATPAARLACFEGLLDVAPVVTEDAPPAAEQSASAPRLETADTPVAEYSPGLDHDVTDDADAPVARPPSALPDDLGREHLARIPAAAEVESEPEPSAVRATVTDVSRDGYRRLRFQFANGQVWRQMERRNFPYPKNGEFDVDISRGMLGDYQLRVQGESRMTRIVRLK